MIAKEEMGDKQMNGTSTARSKITKVDMEQ
jgi:hypothetical protein